VIVLAIVAAVGAVLCWLPPSSRRRTRALFSQPITTSERRRSLTLSDPRLIRWISISAAIMLGFTLGTWWGWVLAVGTALVAPRLLGGLETAHTRERRQQLQKQSADAADLLTACLASGAPVSVSVAAVSEALGQPIAGPLNLLIARLDLGADPVHVWRLLAQEPGLANLSHHVARSLDSGAPLTDVLPGLADDLRRQARAHSETAARSAGVRAVAPLAVCFLPAFLLVGVVPIVASLALPYLSGL